MTLAVQQWDSINYSMYTQCVAPALTLHSVHLYWHLTTAHSASIIHTAKQQRQWYNLFITGYIKHGSPTVGKPTETRKNKVNKVEVGLLLGHVLTRHVCDSEFY